MNLTWKEKLNSYCKQMEDRGYKPATVLRKQVIITYFMDWFGKNSLEHVTEQTMKNFQVVLAESDRSMKTQCDYLSALNGFFKWLISKGMLAVNPAGSLVLPKVPRRLPEVFTRDEIERMLALLDTSTLRGLRDRAIMEVLYSTGMRQSELKNLKLNAIDSVNGFVMIRQGKNRKDRLIPIGERALFWLDRYLVEVRPRLARGEDEGVVMLNKFGRPFRWSGLGILIKNYMRQAGVVKRGACHLFRHAMATHMLEGGADIRYIQKMLGHVELTTTQIYTHVSGKTLKEVHQKTHPLERRLNKKRG